MLIVTDLEFVEILLLTNTCLKMFGQSSGQTGLFGKPANNIFGSPSTTSPFSPQTQQQQQASGGGLFGSTTQKPVHLI